MGDDHALEIVGIGTIEIKMFDYTIYTIQEVRHVKGLRKNLLSLGQRIVLDVRPISKMGS